jgi:hypothetical protein
MPAQIPACFVPALQSSSWSLTVRWDIRLTVKGNVLQHHCDDELQRQCKKKGLARTT